LTLLDRAGGRDDDLRRGLFLTCAGVGAIACLLSLPDPRFWGVGLVPLSAGIGYLITWMIVRARRPDGDA
jgi:hypothetical protein